MRGLSADIGLCGWSFQVLARAGARGGAVLMPVGDRRCGGHGNAGLALFTSVLTTASD